MSSSRSDAVSQHSLQILCALLLSLTHAGVAEDDRLFGWKGETYHGEQASGVSWFVLTSIQSLGLTKQ